MNQVSIVSLKSYTCDNSVSVYQSSKVYHVLVGSAGSVTLDQYSIFCNATFVPPLLLNIISYLLTTELYVALYVIFSITVEISGLHHAKVYVYWGVLAFVGSDGFTISHDNVP